MFLITSTSKEDMTLLMKGKEESLMGLILALTADSKDIGK